MWIIIDHDLIAEPRLTVREKRLLRRFWERDSPAIKVIVCDDCRVLNPELFTIKDEIWRSITNSRTANHVCVACYAKRRGAACIDELLNDFDPDAPQTQICLWLYGNPYPTKDPLDEAELWLQKRLPKIIELSAIREQRWARHADAEKSKPECCTARITGRESWPRRRDRWIFRRR